MKECRAKPCEENVKVSRQSLEPTERNYGCVFHTHAGTIDACTINFGTFLVSKRDRVDYYFTGYESMDQYEELATLSKHLRNLEINVSNKKVSVRAVLRLFRRSNVIECLTVCSHNHDESFSSDELSAIGEYVHLKKLHIMARMTGSGRCFSNIYKLRSLEDLVLNTEILSRRIVDRIRTARNIEELYLEFQQCEKNALDRISLLPKLKSLSLNCPKLNDGHLKTVSEITTLRELYLNDIVLSAKAVSHLKNLKDLEKLSVRGIETAGLEAFAAGFDLKALWIYSKNSEDPQLSDYYLWRICCYMKNLEVLSLCSSSFSDHCFGAIGLLKKLKYFNISPNIYLSKNVLKGFLKKNPGIVFTGIAEKFGD